MRSWLLLRFLQATLAALASVVAASGAQAQGFPAKPVHVVVPFAPGGGADILARALGPRLTDHWRVPVVIENRAGAGGIVGTELVAKAPADGYTLVMGYIGTHAINPSLYPKLPYDAVKDFAPVALVASIPSVLVVHRALPATSVSELIALARSKPGQLNFASGGVGTAPHLAGELFNSLAGVKMVHVPYKGSGPALTELLGGHISLMFNTMSQTIPHVKSGELRALAVTGPRRSPAMPDLPTIAEAGLPGYDVVGWFGLLAPAATPAEVVARINADVNRVLEQPDVKERLIAMGSEPTGISTPEQFGAYIRSEIAKWAKVVKSSGMRAE